MRDLKPSDLAELTGLSRSQIARRAQEIPGYRNNRKGRHHRFRDCRRLREWIMQNKKIEKWNRLTGPFENLPEQYDKEYLKTIGPMGALRFVRAKNELIDRLIEIETWLVNHYTPKMRQRKQ